VEGQRDVGVELDGDVALAAAAAAAPAPASPAPAAAVEGAVAQRGGDHLDVGRGSHQGQVGGSGGGGHGAPAPAGLWVERRRCAAGKREWRGKEVAFRCGGVVCGSGRVGQELKRTRYTAAWRA
jgi:hypothetical protein